MILLLIRHGNAARQGSDRHLRLTPRGRREVLQSAHRIREKEINLTAIWHSPKPRTAETARILSENMGLAPALEEKKELAPDGDPREIFADLMAEKPPALALVSHLPFLERFAYLLLEEMGEVPDMEFPTAGIQAFEWNQGWKWIWSFDPAEII